MSPKNQEKLFKVSYASELLHIAEGDLDWVKSLKSVYHGATGLKKQVEAQDKKIDADEARSIHDRRDGPWDSPRVRCSGP